MIEPTKFCSRCHEVKPWSDYYPQYKWEDGTTRSVYSYCKPCHRVKKREWAQANKETVRRHTKELTERRILLHKRDPEWAAASNDYKREWARRKRGTGNTRKPLTVAPATQHGGPTLPAEPFAEWLRSLGETGADIARVTHLPDRSVWRILNEQKRVELDTVDRALLAVGDGTGLSDLYSTEELAA